MQKDTGELRIWDDIAGECLFETTAELDRDGNPVNQDYYNFLFRNAPYDQSDDYDPKVYMDLDGTLFYRGYWHTTYLYMTNDHVLSSFYDEKERVVYEDGYITSGDLEYYYVYEGDGNIPLCKLDVYFSCHGGIDVNSTWYY